MEIWTLARAGFKYGAQALGCAKPAAMEPQKGQQRAHRHYGRTRGETTMLASRHAQCLCAAAVLCLGAVVVLPVVSVLPSAAQQSPAPAEAPVPFAPASTPEQERLRVL